MKFWGLDMFNNFVNRHDVSRLIWGLRHGYLKKILRRITKNKLGRTRQQWSEKKGNQSCWWMIPRIGKHVNQLISGDEKIDYYNYVSQKYLLDKKDLVALSLGCGNGKRELIWAKLVDFQKIDGCDLSPVFIKAARENAAKAGLDKIIQYQEADILKYVLKDNYYDVVFVEQSLHHFSPLATVLDRIKRAMKPGGLFVINEFIGPDRFQWTDRQIEVANAMKNLIPAEYRRHIVDGSTETKIIKPSRFSMLMKDPSEAIESSKIMPLLREKFNVIDYKPYHSTISHILFNGIAHNFVGKDETKPLIQLLLDMERHLIESGDLDSDYALVVCKKP